MENISIKTVLTATIILVVAVFIFFLYQENKKLRIEISSQKVESIVREDSIQSINYNRMKDSIQSVKNRYEVKIKDLQKTEIKLKKQYEKIYSDYSDIVIKRPIY